MASKDFENYIKQELSGKLNEMETDRKKKVLFLMILKGVIICFALFSTIYYQVFFEPIIGLSVFTVFSGLWFITPIALSKRRVKKGSFLTNTVIGAIGAVGAFVTFFVLIGQTADTAMYWGIILISVLAYYILAYLLFITPYRNAFKEHIVSKAFAFYDPELHYDPKGMVDERDFIDSMLFEKEHFNKYTGEDLIKGTYKDMPFIMSELKVQNEIEYYEEGSRKTETEDIFKGLFMVSNLDQNINEALILTYRDNNNGYDNAPKFLKNFLDAFSSNGMGRLHKFKIRNADFNEDYEVYTSNDNVAENILNPEFIRRLLQFNKYEYWLMMSFVDDRFYIAAYTEDDLLEADIHKSVNDLSVIEDEISVYMTCLSAIDDLKIKDAVSKIA